MTDNQHKTLKQVKLNRIFLPVIIGLGVIVWMLYSELNVDKLKVNLLDEQEYFEDWYSLNVNKLEDEFTLSIKDTTLCCKDTLKIELRYFINDGTESTQQLDTVLILPEKTIQFTENQYLTDIRKNSEKEFTFIFSNKLEHAFSVLRLTKYSIIWIIMALLMMVIRDFGYIVRIKVLSDDQFSWRQAFRVIMLWEFTSAVTPSAIGGTSIAILYVNKEGLSVGRSSAVVLATSFLDEIYFIVMFPILFFTLQAGALFVIGDHQQLNTALDFTNEFFYFAVVGYGLKFAYVLFVSYGLFINPRGLKWLLLSVFKIKYIRKWRPNMDKIGSELVTSSRELRHQSFTFWAKAIVATFLSWSARYWIVNMFLIAFFGIKVFGLEEHFLIFARQLVMWIMMLVSPTPGGSGFAEFIFTRYLDEFIPVAGVVVALALFWRLVTYYPYLVIGVFILPRWIRNKFGKNMKQLEEESK